MFLTSTEAWRLLFTCAGIVAGFLFAAHRTDFKQKVPLFYCWLGAIAVLGGAAAFFLPIAVNSGFAKEDDGSALRQALLYTTGGLLGVITLGETHRKNNQEKEKNENDHIRQVHAERRSRYTTAVEQLANEKAPVRLGGIYTLTGLVDEWLADDSLTKEKQQEEGQVIINNLCSYIRSPFPLAEPVEEHESRKELKELESKKPGTLLLNESQRLDTLRKRFKDSAEYQEPDNITALQVTFHEEQDVRRAIFEEMSKRSSTVSVDESKEVTVTPGTWSGFKFDFSRAPMFYSLNKLTIEQGQFSSAQFYGDTHFVFAKFIRDAHFEGAKFTGGAGFGSTWFIESAYFRGAEFTGDAHFETTEFIRDADFGGAKFTGDVYFMFAKFTGGAGFWSAEFTGGAGFWSAKFTGKAHFTGAKFTGKAHFTDAKLIGGANFNGAYFERYAPTFAANSGAAKFSTQVDPQDYAFSAKQNGEPIKCGTATLDGKRFKIPLGAVLFDPDSWDKEKQKYTRISESAKPLDKSNDGEEDKSK